jgi:hypothetical protein
MKNSLMLTLAALAAVLTLGTVAHGADPVAKVLPAAEDTAKFHFKLADGKIVEVSEAVAEARK